MSNVKKVFVEIANLLEENKNKKVNTILPQLLELMTAKNSGGSDIGSSYLKDDDGVVFAVFCYYHKKWELIESCEYGSKKGTSSGLNTMCKEGVSKWTKQQRVAKKAKSELLDSVADGDIDVSDIGGVQESIEDDRAHIELREDEHGFDTALECTDANKVKAD